MEKKSIIVNSALNFLLRNAILVSSIPLKPLNDAKMSGVFLFHGGIA